MGLKDSVHWLTWFILCTSVMVLIAILLAVLLKVNLQILQEEGDKTSVE